MASIDQCRRHMLPSNIKDTLLLVIIMVSDPPRSIKEIPTMKTTTMIICRLI